jgi:hypothetical protein
MALTEAAVRVAGTGEVYYAPVGTTAPTDATTALSAWHGLGYTTTDGVGFTFGKETTDIDAWQGTKVRSSVTREPATVDFTLMETKTDTLLLAFGGGVVVAAGGISVYTPPAEGTQTERAMCVDFTDGTSQFRYYFPKVQVEGDVTFTLSDADAVSYGLTFGILAGTPKWKLFSNDTSNMTTGS